MNEMLSEWSNLLDHIINVYYPEPITILDLAEIFKNTIAKLTNESAIPRIEILDQGIKQLFHKNDKIKSKVDITKSFKVLGINKFTQLRESSMQKDYKIFCYLLEGFFSNDIWLCI